ncbi:hypothetical protein E4U55_004450 [Claviceps digitariae]|nr:hypothetical protein E4U55_004450 [Claviceps digitariae]
MLGAEKAQKRIKRNQTLCENSAIAVAATPATPAATSTTKEKEKETDMGTVMKNETPKKRKMEDDVIAQAAPKRSSKTRPRGARAMAPSGVTIAAPHGPNDGRPRTRTYSHGGITFTSRLCSDGVWRIENVQKMTESSELDDTAAAAAAATESHQEMSNGVA